MKATTQVFALARPLVLGAGLCSWACTEALIASENRVLNKTVSLEGARGLWVEVPIPLEIKGERRTDLEVRINATVTASSSTLARSLVDGLEILENLRDDGSLQLGVSRPPRGRLSGLYTIRAPHDLDIRVLQRGGTVALESIEGKITVDSVSHVSVGDAENDVTVRVESGNAVVDTRLSPGGITDLAVGTGGIQLTVPLALSANIVAEVETGNIVTSHPRLPRVLNSRLPYTANVGGGLSTVRLSARQGQIVIGTR